MKLFLSSSSSFLFFFNQVVEALPTLPDIPLPAIQPNYRPLPSIETPLSPQRRKGRRDDLFTLGFVFVSSLFCLFRLSVPVSNDEEDAGFTGKRFNSKMMVYSGSKTSYLPKMMSLYQQCIRVLQNNIDCERQNRRFNLTTAEGGGANPALTCRN